MSADLSTEPTMEEENFFSGLKKKKKSGTKKVLLDDEPTPAPPAPAAAAEDDEPAAEDEDNMFGDLKKKKKKKAAPVDLLGNDAVEETPEATTAAVADVSAPDDFSDLKKKKKKSSKKAAFDLEAFERELAEDGPAAAGAGGVEDDEGAEGAVPEYGENELGENVFGSGAGADIPEDGDDSAMPWAGSDRDYTYDELLSRAFRILRSQNPELAGDRRRYTIAPPQMLRDGNKKTIFANLADICKRMHRSDEHVISFLYAELGTSGSVDGSHRLIIKGRYTQKHMENVLRKYIVEYVTCQTCKSPDTLLSKENRIFFMNCQSCGSRRSVAPIKSGFQAQVGRRAKKAA